MASALNNAAAGSRPRTMENDPQLRNLVAGLVKLYHPSAVYLFGSRARGDDGPDSDYDIMVVVPDDAPPEQRLSSLAYRYLWDSWTAADVLVWTNHDFTRRLHLVASLPATIIREGKLLYAA